MSPEARVASLAKSLPHQSTRDGTASVARSCGEGNERQEGADDQRPECLQFRNADLEIRWRSVIMAIRLVCRMLSAHTGVQ